MPIEFVLFGVTLTGGAVFHHHTLNVALGGLAAIVGYQLFFSSFPEGPGLAGLAAHLIHEWVIIANLACLLLGFAILSRHFENSHVPLGSWIRQGWYVALAYVIGCLVLLAVTGWQPHAPQRVL